MDQNNIEQPQWKARHHRTAPAVVCDSMGFCAFHCLRAILKLERLLNTVDNIYDSCL